MSRHESSAGNTAAGPKRVTMLRVERFVRSSLWLVPVACLVVGVLVAVATLAVDRATNYELSRTA